MTISTLPLSISIAIVAATFALDVLPDPGSIAGALVVGVIMLAACR